MNRYGIGLARRLALSALVLCSVAATAQSENGVLFDTDFGTSRDPVLDVRHQPSKAFTGPLSAGWTESSSHWASVRGSFKVVLQDGDKFLRIRIDEQKSGFTQLVHALKAPTELARYRLTARIRNLSAETIQMGVRMGRPPYKFHWQKTGAFSGSWDTYRYEFDLPKLDKPIAFFIVINGTGTVDLDTLEFRRIEGQAEVIGRLEAKYPDGGPSNVVRNSRFPLGLPSGWMSGNDFAPREHDDVTIASDHGMIGPSGAPALKLEGRSVSVVSAPISPVYPVVKHQLSLWLRGSGHWWLSVRSGREQVTEHDIVLAGTGWLRISLLFQPALAGGVYSMRLKGAGRIWIDALQAGPVSKGMTYRSAGECEVALAVPDSDASVARVQFADEAGGIQYCVTGKAGGTVLKGTVTNAYGDQKPIPPVPLDGKTVLHTGQFTYAVFPDRPFGSHRLEAWVERDGKRVSPINEIVVHRLRRPRFWGKLAPDSPFGAHFNSTHARNTMMKAIGINWVRLHDSGISYIGWHYLEPTKGQWDFRDREIHRYGRDKIKVFAQLGTVPRWARKQRGSHSDYHDMYSQPANLADWKAYVRKVVKRYDGVIDTWFVWNEPWMRSRWNVSHEKGSTTPAGYRTSADPQKDFVGLMRASLEAARSVNGDIRVCGVSTSSWRDSDQDAISGTDWTAGIVRHGGLKWCDIVDYHDYSDELNGYAGDAVERAWRRALGPALAGKKTFKKPVWMSEGQAGVGTHHRGLYRHTLPGDQGEDVVATADRVARHQLALLGQGVAKTFLYTPLAAKGLGVTNQYSTLVAADGSLHPSAAALSTLAWHLESTRFARRVAVARGVFAYLFEGPDRAVAVLSSAPKAGAYTIPVVPGVGITDLFGNPLPPGSRHDGTLIYVSARGNSQDLERKLR